jgi:hypothetical protein
MRISVDNRSECYKIDEENFNAMIKRQEELLRQMVLNDGRQGNRVTGTKSKKKKKN